jgi:hypothetical protein
VFAARASEKTVTPDLGLLYAVDEELALYGYLTNTGVRIVVGVETASSSPSLYLASLSKDKKTVLSATAAGVGVRDSDLKPVFRALQDAYVRLLQNPFYDPDAVNSKEAVLSGKGGVGIRNKAFIKEVERIGNTWRAGMKEV